MRLVKKGTSAFFLKTNFKNCIHFLHRMCISLTEKINSYKLIHSITRA
jgi:hypothetical protein